MHGMHFSDHLYLLSARPSPHTHQVNYCSEQGGGPGHMEQTLQGRGQAANLNQFHGLLGNEDICIRQVSAVVRQSEADFSLK